VATEGGLEVGLEALPEGGELVRVAGELDPASVADLEAALLRGQLGARLVLDLSECTFLDSSAIHVILAEAERRRGGGGGVEVVAPGAVARRPLEIAEAGRAVRIHVSIADAVAG